MTTPEFETEDLDVEADDSSTTTSIDTAPKVYTPKEKILRSIQACYPKLYERAVTEKAWDRISVAPNSAGALEIFITEQVLKVPVGQCATIVKALKRILINGTKTFLEAAEKSCLEETYKVYQIRQARQMAA